MKKTILLCAGVALVLASCTNFKAKNVALNDEMDSLNYALGLANGSNLKQYYFASDSSTQTVKEFMQVMDKAYNTAPSEINELFELGTEIGMSLRRMQQTGLAGIASVAFDGNIVMQAMNNGLERFESGMTAEEARTYLQTGMMEARADSLVAKSKTGKINIPTATAEVELTTKADSLNYAFGVVNGDGLHQYYLSNDSTGDKKEQLLGGIKAGLEYKGNLEPQLQAVAKNMGQSIQQMNQKGLMGNPALITNYELIRQGLINGLLEDERQMTASEANMYLSAKMEAIQAKQMEEQFGDNKVLGEQFLAENATKENIQVTESGLQYEVITMGKGEKPAATDKVTVHYHGTLIDGTVFDSSVERGEPATFGLNQVIAGWTEALQLMPVGSKFKIYLPYQLAYGDRDMGEIKPYSALIFEVELLSIEK